MTPTQIVGRTSSLFTRVTLIFAEELAVPYELLPIKDMTELGPEVYGGNPALKLPTLHADGAVLFGAQNIARAIAERPGARSARIVWPEHTRDALSRNANELVQHSMAAQVQLVMGTVFARLPADNVFFDKARAGLEGSLKWLDANVASVLAALPPRDLSFFEVSLFCLIEHLQFRVTVPFDYPALLAFAREFSTRASAQNTRYR
jgi:hypothetical protein